MKTVAISGWNNRFQKVKFTELLRRDFGYSLSDAKTATDAVVDNQRLELQVQHDELQQILSELSRLGAKFVVVGS
jgi:hypothetical protein